MCPQYQRFSRSTPRRGGTEELDSKISVESPVGLQGQLISGVQAFEWLKANICLSRGPIALCTAYLRSEALEQLFSEVKNPLQGKLMARWQLNDLISGASNLEAYYYAKRLGLDFYIRQDFHGKVFSIPEGGIIVGSANATLSGFGVREQSNEEVCTLVESTTTNQALVDTLFTAAIMVTDSLFTEIESAVNRHAAVKAANPEWPIGLLDKLLPNTVRNKFFVSECLIAFPIAASEGLILIDNPADRELLGVSQPNMQIEELRRAFTALNIYKWLQLQLSQAQSPLFFGELSSALHDALIDDPKVYRREVKQILQVLLSWCEELETDVVVDRPNYSQRVQLKVR